MAARMEERASTEIRLYLSLSTVALPPPSSLPSPPADSTHPPSQSVPPSSDFTFKSICLLLRFEDQSCMPFIPVAIQGRHPSTFTSPSPSTSSSSPLVPGSSTVGLDSRSRPKPRTGHQSRGPERLGGGPAGPPDSPAGLVQELKSRKQRPSLSISTGPKPSPLGPSPVYLAWPHPSKAQAQVQQRLSPTTSSTVSARPTLKAEVGPILAFTDCSPSPVGSANAFGRAQHPEEDRRPSLIQQPLQVRPHPSR